MKEPYYRQLNAWAQVQAAPQPTSQQQFNTISGLSVAVGDASTSNPQLLQQQLLQPQPAAAAGAVGGTAPEAVVAEGGAIAQPATASAGGGAGNGAAQSATAGFYALAV
jgi:hypothetical protein